MAAYFVLLFAVFSRLLPHSFHVTGMNFTAVGGGLLFFGSRLSGSVWTRALKLGLAVGAMALMDAYLTRFVYGFPFHVQSYLVTWAWYAAVCLLGFGLLGRRVSALRVAGSVLASATSFFLLSNFVVWVGSALYPHTAAGLATCFTLAIPFYANDLASTGLVAVALFGLPIAAARLAEMVRGTQTAA